jgi:Poly(ADP-ribose) polymerase catalytic domain
MEKRLDAAAASRKAREKAEKEAAKAAPSADAEDEKETGGEKQEEEDAKGEEESLSQLQVEGKLAIDALSDSSASASLLGNTSLKGIWFDTGSLILTVRLDNHLSTNSSNDGGSGSGNGNDSDDDDDGPGAEKEHKQQNAATDIDFQQPGLFIQFSYTSDYPVARPLVRVKANDGSFDQDVVAGLVLTTNEFSRDRMVTVTNAASYLAQQFNSRFPMRGLAMSTFHDADDLSDSDSDIWEGDVEGEADNNAPALDLDALKMLDLFGKDVGVTVAKLFDTSIQIKADFIEDDVAVAIGIDRKLPIVFETVWAESYMLARTPPKFKLEQPGNASFAVQFQLQQVMNEVIESCMGAVRQTGSIDTAIANIPFPHGLDEAAAASIPHGTNQPAFSNEVYNASTKGHQQLAAALAYLSARYAQSTQPLVDCTSLLAWSQYDFATKSRDSDVDGARWSRLVGSYTEDDNAPPAKSAGCLVEILSHIIFRLRDITSFCMICDAKLEGSGIKPTVCSQDLCVFRHEELGLGSNISNELAVDADVVDLVTNISYGSAHNTGRRDLVFNPFPPEFYVGDTGKLDDDSKVKDFAKLETCMSHIPAISVLESCNGDEKQIRSILESAAGITPGMKDPPPSPYRLLRWMLNTMRAHLVKVPSNQIMTEMQTPHQYVMLSAPPERRAKFMKLRETHGSFFAWHGSSVENWHAIMRNGLRNLSNTKLMTCGAAYGAGIYLSPWSDTSRGYARKGKGWAQSRFGSADLQMIALCEVINHPDLKDMPNPHYVIQDEDFIVTRFLLVYVDGKNIPRVDSRTLDKYKSTYGE